MDILRKIGGFFANFGIHVNKKVKQKKYSSHFRESKYREIQFRKDIR